MKLLSRLTLLHSLWVFLGCASYTDVTGNVRSAYIRGDYSTALEDLEASPLKESDRSQLLYYLEKAVILDRLGNQKAAQGYYRQADKLVDELYTLSISNEAVSYLYNDSATDYGGEDFEKVAIHTMSALAFLAADQRQSALIEARRINTKLREINGRYDEGRNRYGKDAFARLLAGLIYESNGELDSAIIEYQRAVGIYEDLYVKQFDTDPPELLVRALARVLRLRGRTDRLAKLRKSYPAIVGSSSSKGSKSGSGRQGRILVIHEIGTITRKTRAEHLVPWDGKVVRMSFPVIRYQRSVFGRTGVRLAGGDFASSEIVQNMDAIAAKTLEDRRLRISAKMLARLVVKDQLNQQAEKNLGPLGGLAANIYGAVTETADTRSWTLLPAAFAMTELEVPPGKHRLMITTDGRTSEEKVVRIRAGEVVFVRALGLPGIQSPII